MKKNLFLVLLLISVTGISCSCISQKKQQESNDNVDASKQAIFKLDSNKKKSVDDLGNEHLSSIIDIWRTYIDLIESKKSGIKTFLNPPATDSEIALVEEQIGRKLPEDIKKIYLINNGQVSNNQFEGLFLGLNFMTLDEIYRTWKQHSDISKGETEESMEKLYGKCSSYPENTVKKLYASEKRIPFATDMCGNYIGIDLDPDVCGIVGQVIIYGRDEMEHVVVTENIKEYLELLIEQVKLNNYRIEEEDEKIFLWYKEDKHPNDILKNLIKNKNK